MRCCDLIDHDTLSLWCGHLHSALSLSVFISVYHHPSLCLPSSSSSSSSSTSSSSSYTKHPVLFCTSPTFLISPFPPSSLSFSPSLLNPSFAAAGVSLSLSLSLFCPSLSFFFQTPSILELKSCNHSLVCWTPLCLTFSSALLLPAPLICDACPWRFPSYPSLASFTLLYTAQPAITPPLSPSLFHSSSLTPSVPQCPG